MVGRRNNVNEHRRHVIEAKDAIPIRQNGGRSLSKPIDAKTNGSGDRAIKAPSIPTFDSDNLEILPTFIKLSL